MAANVISPQQILFREMAVPDRGYLYIGRLVTSRIVRASSVRFSQLKKAKKSSMPNRKIQGLSNPSTGDVGSSNSSTQRSRQSSALPQNKNITSRFTRMVINRDKETQNQAQQHQTNALDILENASHGTYINLYHANQAFAEIEKSKNLVGIRSSIRSQAYGVVIVALIKAYFYEYKYKNIEYFDDLNKMLFTPCVNNNDNTKNFISIDGYVDEIDNQWHAFQVVANKFLEYNPYLEENSSEIINEAHSRNMLNYRMGLKYAIKYKYQLAYYGAVGVGLLFTGKSYLNFEWETALKFISHLSSDSNLHSILKILYESTDEVVISKKQADDLKSSINIINKYPVIVGEVLADFFESKTNEDKNNFIIMQRFLCAIDRLNGIYNEILQHPNIKIKNEANVAGSSNLKNSKKNAAKKAAKHNKSAGDHQALRDRCRKVLERYPSNSVELIWQHINNPVELIDLNQVDNTQLKLMLDVNFDPLEIGVSLRSTLQAQFGDPERLRKIHSLIPQSIPHEDHEMVSYQVSLNARIEALDALQKSINNYELDLIKNYSIPDSRHVLRLYDFGQVITHEPNRVLARIPSDNVIEIKLQIENTASGARAPMVFVHLHAKSDIVTSDFFKYNCSDFSALHIKTERQQKLGHKWERWQEACGRIYTHVHRGNVTDELWKKIQEKLPKNVA